MKFKKIFVLFGGLGLLILGGILYFEFSIFNTPSTSKVFFSKMQAREYEVFELKSNDFDGTLEQYKAYKLSDYGNGIQVLFYRFSTNEEARQAFLEVYEKVHEKANLEYVFLNESGLFGNTQYYENLTRSSRGVETMMCSVDNTLLIAQANEWPIPEAEEIFKALGYRYP